MRPVGPKWIARRRKISLEDAEIAAGLPASWIVGLALARDPLAGDA
jgi:hypothetical protein